MASNTPIEDTRTEANCIHTNGFLAGIFDGHAGPACAQVTAKRLLRYIAASLIPPNVLREHIQSGVKSNTFLKSHNEKADFVAEIKAIYEKSFSEFTNDLLHENLDVGAAMENAFLRLDQDFSKEALENPTLRTLSVTMSGAVACVAHIEGRQLHVANSGDCVAVLGQQTDTGQWLPKKLSAEHNTDNVAEVRRVLDEHPPSERDTVIKVERLFGQLIPLRALGDYRYKWSREILDKLVVPHYGEHVIPPNYLTPPYLTAQPEVQHHVLTPKDGFLIIASDGLWDLLSPMQAVKLVGEHMSGKAFLQPLKLPKHDVTLGEISKLLVHRKYVLFFLCSKS